MEMSSEFGLMAEWDLPYCPECYEKRNQYGECPYCDVEPVDDEEE